MKYYICLIYLFVLGLSPFVGKAQTGDKVLRSPVATIQTYKLSGDVSERMRMPILKLAENGKLLISFDLLDSSGARLSYSLRHCNADGSDSDLSVGEAFRGISSGILADFQPSLTTGISYQHYELTLPNERVDFAVSGRFALSVYSEDKELFSIPIYVYEDVGTMTLRQEDAFTSVADKMHQTIAQEVGASQGLRLNLGDDLKIYTYQNESNLIPYAVQSKPTTMTWDKWIYERSGAAVFWAGNGYKYIEHYYNNPQSYGIEMVKGDTLQTSPLVLSQPAIFSTETKWGGLDIVRQREGIGSDRLSATQAEYQLVRFCLMADEELEGDLLLEGAAFDYLPNECKRMVYDAGQKSYTLTIPLKEGYQEYRYMLIPRDKEQYKEREPIDGSFYETPNSYRSLLYRRQAGDRYDHLLLVQSLSAEKQ